MPAAQLIVRTHLAATFPADDPNGAVVDTAWLRSFLLGVLANTVAPGVIRYRESNLVIATVPDTDEVIIMGRVDYDTEFEGAPVTTSTIRSYISAAGPDWLAPGLANPTAVICL